VYEGAVCWKYFDSGRKPESTLRGDPDGFITCFGYGDFGIGDELAEAGIRS